MRTLILVFVVSTLTTIFVFLIRKLLDKKQKKQERIYSPEHKSIDLYKDREPYQLTLWWGDNGLRFNEDGTTKWINKNPAIFEAKKLDYTISQSLFATSLQGFCDPQSAIQNQMSTLVNQISASKLQMEQTLQALHIMSVLSSFQYSDCT